MQRCNIERYFVNSLIRDKKIEMFFIYNRLDTSRMERILPDDIVQRIIDWKCVKDTSIECHRLWREYHLANETVKRQLALSPFINSVDNILHSERYLDLSSSMQTRICEMWQSTIDDTLVKSIKAQIILNEWIDAKMVCEAALLKVA